MRTKLGDVAFIAPTLHANNLLEIDFDSEESCFIILPNIEAYDKFVCTINFLETNHTLDIHLRPISHENSPDKLINQKNIKLKLQLLICNF
jgi:hypothetical protein